MNNEIDLSKYNLRTDLLVETIKDDENIKSDVQTIDEVKITRVFINEENEKKIGKKSGNYITIEFNDVTDHTNKEKVKKIFSEELKELIKELKIKEDAYCLIVGLGNDKSTPDSLGPLSINNKIGRASCRERV